MTIQENSTRDAIEEARDSILRGSFLFPIQVLCGHVDTEMYELEYVHDHVIQELGNEDMDNRINALMTSVEFGKIGEWKYSELKKAIQFVKDRRIAVWTACTWAGRRQQGEEGQNAILVARLWCAGLATKEDCRTAAAAAYAAAAAAAAYAARKKEKEAQSKIVESICIQYADVGHAMFGELVTVDNMVQEMPE